MILKLLIAVALMPATVVQVSAFCTTTTPPARAFVSKRRPPVFATIYYPDEDGNMQSRAESSSIGTTTYSPPQEESYWDHHFPAAVAELDALEAGLVRSESAPLARLVAATSHADIRNIRDLHVIGLDGNHMDVAATVCEQESCVSLAVPLAFPHPCPDGNVVPEDDATAFEQCVLDNIHELDELNNQNPAQPVGQEQQATERHLEALRRTDNVELPSWWVHPGGEQQITDECNSLLRILNEDNFQVDIRNLAAAEAGFDNDYRSIVQWAAVVAVGPAGMVVRATVGHDRDGDQLETVEIPIRFPETAQGSEQLRDAVLTAVEEKGTVR